MEADDIIYEIRLIRTTSGALQTSQQQMVRRRIIPGNFTRFVTQTTVKAIQIVMKMKFVMPNITKTTLDIANELCCSLTLVARPTHAAGGILHKPSECYKKFLNSEGTVSFPRARMRIPIVNAHRKITIKQHHVKQN